MPEKKNQYIDIHCHILPEVDDGARNLEESLAMLRQEVKQGVEAVILTPHQKPNRPSITAASVLERTQKLQQAATENGIDIRLYSGGEIFWQGGNPRRIGLYSDRIFAGGRMGIHPELPV